MCYTCDISILATEVGRPLSGLSARTPGQPQHLTLLASPNPFNPRTRFDFRMPSLRHVKLEVFDTAGRAVASNAPAEPALTLAADARSVRQT